MPKSCRVWQPACISIRRTNGRASIQFRTGRSGWAVINSGSWIDSLGHIGVKVTGSVQDGTISGQFRRLAPELLFFLIIFGLCVVFGVYAISQGSTTAFLDVLMAFFFFAYLYIYRTLRYRDLISRSLARTLDVKE